MRSQGRFIQDLQMRTSPAVQWLRLHTSTTCSISGRGSKTPHVTLRSKKKKKKWFASELGFWRSILQDSSRRARRLLEAVEIVAAIPGVCVYSQGDRYNCLFSGKSSLFKKVLRIVRIQYTTQKSCHNHWELVHTQSEQ